MKGKTQIILQIASFTLSALFATALFNYGLRENGIPAEFSPLWNALISIVTALLLYISLSFTSRMVLVNIAAIRRRLDAKGAFEGQWLQSFQLGQKTHFCLANIGYDRKIKQHTIQGIHFDSAGNEIGSWRSKTLHLDSHEETACYVYRSHASDDHLNYPMAYAQLRFSRENERRMGSAEGILCEAGKQLNPARLTMQRLDGDEIHELIGRKKFRSTKDMSKFIKKFALNEAQEAAKTTTLGPPVLSTATTRQNYPAPILTHKAKRSA